MNNKKTKEKGVIYITHSGELLFLLIVILVVVIISTLCFIHNQKNRENDYYAYLPDVNGLIVGSPVRMMGIEVGHVIELKPTKEDVRVKFILTRKGVYIPQGTEYTVEFSGMAGSRSLELYPPDEDTYVSSSTPLLTCLPPKRLNEAISMLNYMYKKLTSIIYTTSTFGEKLGAFQLNKDMNFDREQVSESFKYYDGLIDDATIKAENLNKILNERINHAK